MKIILTALLLYTGASYGQLTGEEIIKQSADSLRKLRSITYNIYSKEFGATLSADIIVNRKKEYPVFGVAQIKVTGIAMNDEGSSQIAWASDGNRFEFSDTKKNAIVQIDNPDYQKIFRVIFSTAQLPLVPYFEKEPFENVLKSAKNYELLKDTVVYGVPCYAVYLNNETESEVVGIVRSTATWYIGKNDFLLYGVEYNKVSKFVKIKEINKKYDDAVFRISPSQGIEKITGLEPISDGLLSVGTLAPDWTLPSPSLNQVTMNKLRGKVVLLDFWGTWCVPCIRAMPEIQAIFDHFRDSAVEVIGVSVEMEKKADPAAFVKKKGFTYPIALNGNTITEKYKVIQFPSIYIIDKSGKIVHAEHSTNRANFKEDIISRIDVALKKQ